MGKFPTKGPHLLGATVQNLVATAIRTRDLYIHDFSGIWLVFVISDIRVLPFPYSNVNKQASLHVTNTAVSGTSTY